LFIEGNPLYVNNLGLSEEQRNDSAAIIEAIKWHIHGQISESVEHLNLRIQRQQPGESFEVALREKDATFPLTFVHKITLGTRSLRG